MKNFAAAFLIVSVLVQLPLVQEARTLNSDIGMVTISTRSLLETNSLASVGSSTAFQALRPGFVLAQPYYYNYVGPVFLLAPLFAVFGSSDGTFYFGQTLLWLLILFGLKRRIGDWLNALGIFSLLLLFKTLHGATFLSPSQLPVIALSVWIWNAWERPSSPRQTLLVSACLGVGMHFRPESLFVLFIYGVEAFRGGDSQKQAIQRVAKIAIVAVLAYLPFAILRKVLGAAGSEDHTFFTLGTQIFAPSFSTLSLLESQPLSRILTDESLRTLALRKALSSYKHFLALDGQFWTRKDCFLVLVSLGFWFAKVSSRRYQSLLVLLALQAFLNGLVLDIARYYDWVMVLFVVQIYEDVLRLARERRWELQGGAVWVASLLMLVAGVDAGLSVKAAGAQRKMLTEQVEMARLRVPSEAFVVTDDPALWQWYAGGRYSCFAPGSEATMSALLKKFPDAYVLLFKGSKSVGPAANVLFDTDRVTAPDSLPLIFASAKK